MQAKVLRNSLPARARHGKRQPQVSAPFGGDVTGIPGPITITVIKIKVPPTSQSTAARITPTVTVFVPPSPSPDVPLPSSSTLVITTSSESTTTSVTQPPSPSASANNNGNVSQSSATSSFQGLSTGSIIGIVIAVSFVVIVASFFLIRKRSVRSRLRLRGWANKKGPGGPSFLWIEPREKITPFPNMSQKRETAPTDPSLTRTQTRVQLAPLPVGDVLPYIPPPAPPRPPPAHGTEGDYYGPTSPVSTAATSTPGTGFAVSRKPPPPSTPASGAAVSPPPPEMAKVRSTFIPTLSDELSISNGEVIFIRAAYDDGWAFCSNASGVTGMVPLECLERVSQSQDDEAREYYKKLSRVSSLSINPYGGYY